MPQSIVISGLSGRFPSSNDLDEFKANLYAGRDMIREDTRRVNSQHYKVPKRMGVVDTLDKFDAEYFGLTPQEAELMEPTERVCLEMAYEAFFDAGITPSSVASSELRWAVYHGACFSSKNFETSEPDQIPPMVLRDLTRLSAHLGIKGPIFHSDTACASGLTAFNEVKLPYMPKIVSDLKKLNYAIAGLHCASRRCYRRGLGARIQRSGAK